MSTHEGPAAPASGSFDDIASFEELVADPEIAALLDFEPVPRRIEVVGGWSPAKQQEFIARLAVHGSKNKACTEMGMHTTGMTKLQNSPQSKSFRAAWEAAVDLARRRREAKAAEDFVRPGTRLPTIDHRKKHAPSPQPLSRLGGEGQVLNELGEYEDEGAFRERVEDARDSIAKKLLRLRRLYLQEISSSPGKRAAFEILTDLIVDWEKAAALQPQGDEPYTVPNMRQPEFVLTAEAGWMGHMARGRDKIAELRQAIDEHRAEEGLPPVDWET
jgi:hypothetical protein